MERDHLGIILVVDDSEAERRLIRLTITGLNRAAQMIDVTNGIDCLAYVRREGAWVNAIRPELIILDNNMPGLSGTEVLEALNRDAELRNIPVLHWSSVAGTDAGSAFRSRACGRKPLSLDEYRSVFESVWELLPASR
jgi:CheY-like chemotaxis protein